MLSTECSLIIVQGTRGSGKTNSTKEELKNTEPLYIVDIRSEYKHIPAFYTLKAFILFLQDDGFAKTKQEGRKLQFRFAFSTRKEWTTLFGLFSSFKNCTIVVDEADALFSVSQFEKPLIDMFLGARNNKVSLIFIGKRPFLIPIVVRSQADEWHVFSIEEPRDVDYLSKRIRKEFPKDPFNLKLGEAIVFQSGQKPVLKQYKKFQGE